MDAAVQAFWLTIVAMLWGGTNPFLRSGGAGIETVKKRNVILQFFAETYFLLSNWKYMVPFLLNQSGSVLYYVTLSTVDLSQAVPVTNSLTFIFTTLVGRLRGEMLSKETYVGMGCVLAGVTLCVFAKS